MATSKRDLIKRKHGAVSNALDRCMGWTGELYSQFKPVHPEYAEGYAVILVMLEQAKVFIEKMRDHV